MNYTGRVVATGNGTESAFKNNVDRRGYFKLSEIGFEEILMFDTSLLYKDCTQLQAYFTVIC